MKQSDFDTALLAMKASGASPEAIQAFAKASGRDIALCGAILRKYHDGRIGATIGDASCIPSRGFWTMLAGMGDDARADLIARCVVMEGI